MTAVLIGSKVDGLARELVCYGVDKVIYADAPLLERYTTDGYAKVICDLANERKPEMILVGATYLCRDLALVGDYRKVITEMISKIKALN